MIPSRLPLFRRTPEDIPFWPDDDLREEQVCRMAPRSSVRDRCQMMECSTCGEWVPMPLVMSESSQLRHHLHRSGHWYFMRVWLSFGMSMLVVVGRGAGPVAVTQR